MKIVVFVEHFPPYMGSDRRIYEIMRRIADKNEIHFIVFPSVRFLTNKKITHKKIEDVKNTKIIGHSIYFPRILANLWDIDLKIGYLFSIPYLFYKSVLLLKTIKSEAIVLNYPSPYTGLIGLLASKVSRLPVILDFNDLIAQYAIILFNLPRESLVSKTLTKIQDIIAKSCDRVVATTSFIKSYCLNIDIDPKKITIISNGVDFKHFRRHIKKIPENSRFTCAYAGNLESWAGTNIIKKMAELDGYIQYLVCGSGDSSGFPQNVTKLGYVPTNEIPEVLLKSDCILVPFPFNEMTQAVCPLKLFEAMATGRPVISSNLSGIRDITTHGENGMLVDSEDPQEWLNTVKILIKNVKLREKISENAKKDAKMYDWEILANKFEKNIQETILQKYGLCCKIV